MLSFSKAWLDLVTNGSIVSSVDFLFLSREKGIVPCGSVGGVYLNCDLELYPEALGTKTHFVKHICKIMNIFFFAYYVLLIERKEFFSNLSESALQT